MELKLQGGAAGYGVSMVGTCNGLLCLYRCHGDVVVVNPVTGEKIAVPLPPKTSGVLTPAAAYSFAYHPATVLYKIVHVPCHAGGGPFDAVNVLTLGDGSWREVPVPVGTSCRLSFGLVSVDGATYWVSNDAHSVMRSTSRTSASQSSRSCRCAEGWGWTSLGI
ncbi:hypothetical protein PAHAL_6G248000 [Panicum hallii]|jgi:F-box interacting protein|uniref:F-box associated beta-propeller type 1 domain-containing protein n=1 Tax=Panicum hallii TaxID=206008 RepID=A0A2T8IHE7_9POAL|nr:hypothetical protein PAHAL_6G248000 [Panicum hallii]